MLFAAINIATCDAFAFAVVVFGDRVNFRNAAGDLLTTREGVFAFTDAPAIVPSIDDNVDLFPKVLTDIARPASAIFTVEGELPDVTKACAEDFRSPALELDRVAKGRIV